MLYTNYTSLSNFRKVQKHATCVKINFRKFNVKAPSTVGRVNIVRVHVQAVRACPGNFEILL